MSHLLTDPSAEETTLTAPSLDDPEPPEALSLEAPGAGTVEDQAEFAALSWREQERVWKWYGLMRRVYDADKAHGTKVPVMHAIAREEGVSFGKVRGKYYAWEKRGWRALVNKRTHRAPVIPQATVQYMTGLVEGHQRKTVVAECHRKLRMQLTAWEADGGRPDSPHAIPGYHTPPRRNRSGGGLPPGWDYKTVARVTKRWREDAARKQGPKAFSATMPSIRGTREGCAVGEILQVDDQVFDQLCAFPGNNTGMRPLAFHLYDTVSACDVFRGFKPVIQDGNSRRTVASQLTKADFDWFLIGYLTLHGYNAVTGTTIVGEMGTACASAELQSNILSAFGEKGKLRWTHSGRFGEPLKGMIYEGKSCGNFRFKAIIESAFNRLRNSMCHLPGQAGRNRDHAPEETEGVQRDVARVLRWFETLPEERRELLRMPILEWHTFCRAAHEIIEQINQRTEHNLGQWEKMGFIRPVFLDDLKEPLRSKAMQNPALMQMLAAENPGLRKLSPREVWDAGSKNLRRLSPSDITTLMPKSAARIVKVGKDRTITITDREIDSDPLHYTAVHCINAHGDHVALRPGDEAIAFLNPFAPQQLHLCRIQESQKGAFLGSCDLERRTSRNNELGFHEACGKRAAVMAPVMADIAARGTAESNRRAAIRAINKRVADTSKPLTAAEHAAVESQHALTAAFAGDDEEEDFSEPSEPNTASDFSRFAD